MPRCSSTTMSRPAIRVHSHFGDNFSKPKPPLERAPKDRKLLFCHRTEAKQGKVVGQGGDGGFRAAAAALNPPSPSAVCGSFLERVGAA